MKCTICGTHMDRIITDLPFKLSEGRIVILRQLPVFQCGACSGYLLDDGVMARIDEILAAVRRKRAVGGARSLLGALSLPGARFGHASRGPASRRDVPPSPHVPLAEQRRIVAQVDQLMALVDRLEAQIAAGREVGARVMEAVVAEMAAA